jgi:hypothetical protein
MSLIKPFLAGNASAFGEFSRIRSGRFQEILKSWNSTSIPSQEEFNQWQHGGSLINIFNNVGTVHKFVNISSSGRILSSLLFTVTSTALPWDFYFFKLTQPLTVSVKEKGGKPNRKPWLKKSIQKPQVWELSRLFPETSVKLYVHDFGFWSQIQRCECPLEH